MYELDLTALQIKMSANKSSILGGGFELVKVLQAQVCSSTSLTFRSGKCDSSYKVQREQHVQ